MGEIVSYTPTGINTIRSRVNRFIIPCTIPLIAAFILTPACDWFMNEEKDQAQAVVLEIRSDPTFYPAGESSASFSYTGVQEYDLNEDQGELIVSDWGYEEYDPNISYRLITARQEMVHGTLCSGYKRRVGYHEQIPASWLIYLGVSNNPDTLFIVDMNEHDDITIAFRDSTFILKPLSNKLWIDSLYIVINVGSLGIEYFVIDSLTFIHHGELRIISAD